MNEDNIIDKSEFLFFEAFNALLLGKAGNTCKGPILISYIQNHHLIRKKYFTQIPGITSEELLLYDIKEALYKKDFDCISSLLEKSPAPRTKDHMVETFLFSTKSLLQVYKGDLDIAEKEIGEFLSRYKSKFHERLRLFIYSFMFYFYPNIPIANTKFLEEHQTSVNSEENLIFKFSILSKIYKSIKNYDKFYFYLSKAMMLCLKHRDIVSFLQLYDQHFYHEFIRGSISRIFLPLDELCKTARNKGGLKILNQYYRFLYDYFTGLCFDIKSAESIFNSLSKRKLFPYMHRLLMLISARGINIRDLSKDFPIYKAFKDLHFINKDYKEGLQRLPFFIPEEFRPIFYYNKLSTKLRTILEEGTYTDDHQQINYSTGHYSIYQSYKEICLIIDAIQKCDLFNAMDLLAKRSKHRPYSSEDSMLTINIQMHTLELSSNLNNELVQILRRSIKERDGFDPESYICRDLDKKRAQTIINLLRIGPELNLKADHDLDQVNDNIELEELNSIVGTSREVERIKKSIAKFSRFNYPVLIAGESGTGKELIARAIHDLSKRHGRFVPINCSAIPEDLFESELFGFKKGAFSGASFDKKGLIESADNGTLFLDEIGEMPFRLQAKLLRFLQEGEVLTIGDKESKVLNVRVVAATNINIHQEIANKTFRNDLYQRLNVFSINLCPLRDRKEDIRPLVEHFYNKYKDEFGIDNIINLRETILMFEKYDWPGNIRELENEIIRIFAHLCGDNLIKPEYLSQNLQNNSETVFSASFIRPSTHSSKPSEEVIIQTWEKLNKNVGKTSEMLSVTRQWVCKVLRKHGLI